MTDAITNINNDLCDSLSSMTLNNNESQQNIILENIDKECQKKFTKDYLSNLKTKKWKYSTS